MSQFSVMQNNVSTELYDESQVYWPLADVKAAINAANVDFCDRTKILRSTDTVEMATGTADYDVPSGCGIIMYASFGDSKTPVGIFGEPEMRDIYGPYWRNATGSTIQAITQTFTGPTQFTVYPKPTSDANGEDLTLYFSKSPPDTLTDDTDEPEFPAQFHRALEVYAMHLLLRRDIDHQNLPKADMYLAEYEVGRYVAGGTWIQGWVPRALTYVARHFKTVGSFVPPPDIFWE